MPFCYRWPLLFPRTFINISAGIHHRKEQKHEQESGPDELHFFAIFKKLKNNSIEQATFFNKLAKGKNTKIVSQR